MLHDDPMAARKQDLLIRSRTNRMQLRTQLAAFKASLEQPPLAEGQPHAPRAGHALLRLAISVAGLRGIADLLLIAGRILALAKLVRMARHLLQRRS